MRAFIRGAWRTFSDKDSQARTDVALAGRQRSGDSHRTTADPTRSESSSIGRGDAAEEHKDNPKQEKSFEKVKVEVETEKISSQPTDYIDVYGKREELPPFGLESGAGRRYWETGQDSSVDPHLFDKQVDSQA